MRPFTAVVAGALANKPGSGGEAWVRLNWALGLHRLGFRVLFVEQLSTPEPGRSAVEYFEAVTTRFGLDDAALLHGADTVAGISIEAVREAAHGAELFVNLSGNLRDLTLVDGCRRKVYVDLDPGYTQFWHANGIDVGLAGHDHYVTVGARIGDADCAVPTSGFDWQPVAPPVVLDQWPVAATAAGRFTTVATWRGAYGRAEYNGHVYGLKAHEFRRMRDLPRRSPFVFELALAIDPADEADRAELVDAGWQLVRPDDIASGPERFRDYVRASSAEFSIAQGIYVETQCGWFSDRTAAYLAAGKPVLLQDTGFADAYRSSKGVVSFRTLEEAVAGAAEIVSDYPEHCRAARRLAEEYFDSDIVLGRLLEHVGAVP
jgi:hypothetical protein